MRKKTWLITGGGGFIGSAVATELVKQNQKVIVYDNFSSPNAAVPSAIAKKVKIIKADVTDIKALRKAAAGADYIIHLAAAISVAQSVADPAQTQQINAGGTLNVLLAAREAKVKRVVLASSAAVYGNNPAPHKETAAPDCRSPYAASKLIGEELCKMFYKTYGVETVSLRIFNAFGPGQSPHSQYPAAVAKFIHAAQTSDTFNIDWDGRQSRDFVYISDIVQGIILGALKAKPGEVYNLSSGKSYTILQLARIVETAAGKKINRRFLPKRGGDIKKSCADISKIKKIGYRPAVTLEQGVKKIIKEA